MGILKGLSDIVQEEKKPTKFKSIRSLTAKGLEEVTVAPTAPTDMAKIMGKPAEEVPTKPVMGLEYVPAKVVSYLIVEPIAASASLMADLLAAGFDKLGVTEAADYFKKSSKTWKNLPFIEKVKHQTAYIREQSYKSSQAAGVIFDVSEAATRLGALLVQIGTLGKVPSLKDVARGKIMFGHAFFTTEGTIAERAQAAVTRLGYSITPFIAQHWGATGIKSVAIDAALNTFLTSSVYIEGFKQAQKTGKWDEFISLAVTQFTMDIGMALSTQGYPAAQRSAAIAKHLKAHPEGQLTPKEFEAVLDSFWKAQGDKAIVVKGETLPVPKVKRVKGRGVALEVEKLAVTAGDAKWLKDYYAGKMPGVYGINPRTKEPYTREEYAAVLEGRKVEPVEKPRETREQLVDKLTKKDANKAPVVTALEDAKAKPSDVTDAALKTAFEAKPTRGQIARIKFLVGQKGLLTPTDKQRAQHKAFLKALTGESSVTKMNQGQVQLVISTLDRWHPKTVRAVYEMPVKFITPELIDMIQGLREIGFKEDFRDAYHVWQKIGLVREIYEATEKAEVDMVERIEADTKIALQYEKSLKDIPDSDGRVFRMLNNTLTKADKLSLKELETVKWLRSHFDKWADDLDLPPEKRRKHYVTNIIEAAIVKDLKENKFLNTDFLRAMEYGPGAKEIFHPYLQARRGLRGKGVKESWTSAFEAYEGYSARKLYYDPILSKISLLSKFLPPNAERYAREYKKRMTGELSAIDKRMNFTLREMGEVIAKLPGGKGFAEFLMKGNPAGTISYHAAGLLYVSYLGLMPRSSIRNASQSVLTIAEVGAKAFLKGGEWLRTAEGKKALKEECTILRQRRFAALPGLNIAELRGKLKKVEDAALYLFKFPDIKFSVPRAFGAGFVEARDLGLPYEYCIRRGNEVARKCQYAYSAMASSLVSQSSVGRVLGVFTTWPRQFLEIGYEWVAGKPSQVYVDYKKDTGIDVIPESWAANRAAMLRYIAIVALASIIERKTAFRATEYTGWTSLKGIPRILAGELAGLQIPAGAVGVVLGMAEYMATGDPYLMKKGWNMMRPDKQVLIVKSLKDVFDGKKDWMDLLLYLEKGKGLKKYPRLR